MRLTYDLWLAKLRTADADCPPSPVDAEGFSPPFEPDAEPVGGRVRFVAPGGLGNGESWVNASGNLQGMINVSASGDHIYVLEGIYPLTVNIVPQLGVSIYGGFKADNPIWASRNPFKYPSIFDADFKYVGYMNTTVDFAVGQVIDGITIINHVCSAATGGAFYGTKKSTLKHCSSKKSIYTFSSTNADFCGSNFTLINCMVQGHVSDYSSCFYLSNSTMKGCIAADAITGTSNVAINSGITVDNSTVEKCRVNNCHFRGTTQNGSAGISAKNNSKVIGCMVSNCVSYYGVGVLATTGRVENCIVVNCFSTVSGGSSAGVFCGFSGSATFCNCLVVNCVATSSSGYAYILSVPSASNSEATALKFINNAAVGNSKSGCYISGANCYSKIRNCVFESPITYNTNAAVNCDSQNIIDNAVMNDCKFFDYGKARAGYTGYSKIFGDFHIAIDSILANAGFWEDGVIPVFDLDGNPRSNNQSKGTVRPLLVMGKDDFLILFFEIMWQKFN